MALPGAHLHRREFLRLGPATAAALVLDGRLMAAEPFANGSFAIKITRDGLAHLQFAAEDGVLEPSMAWHLGSNTKAITALLYAGLVEQGVARWGATLGELFPDIPVHPDLAGATAQDLMAHAAGLSDFGIDTAWLNARRADRAPITEQRANFARQWLSRPPTAARGVFSYANANYIVLGAAIEHLTATAWEAAVQAHIFAPLGLASAGFGAPRQDRLWGRASVGNSVLPLAPSSMADNPPIFGPAGTVHMTPADYASYLAIYLNGGAPIVRQKTRAHLLTPPVPGVQHAGGWGLTGGPDAKDKALVHDGSNTLWYARAMVLPEQGLAFAAGTNRGGAGGREAVERVMTMMRDEL